MLSFLVLDSHYSLSPSVCCVSPHLSLEPMCVGL